MSKTAKIILNLVNLVYCATEWGEMRKTFTLTGGALENATIQLE